MFRFFKTRKRVAALGAVLLVMALLVPLGIVAADKPDSHQVVIPEEDRFVPFAMVIREGESVQWTNKDADDHEVVSNDFFTTTDNKGTDAELPGTESTKGKPSTLTLRFDQAGLFAYYCGHHSHLDSEHQPVAPGPDGGIQDKNGNFGTPMNGIIVVLPSNGSSDDN